jgi:hypothetical protein
MWVVRLRRGGSWARARRPYSEGTKGPP